MLAVKLDPQSRGGSASGPLVALQDNPLALSGADLPQGADVALVTPSGILLAACETEDAEGHATLPLATREVADATRALPLGRSLAVHLLVSDGAGLLAAVPLELLPNKLPALAALPTAPVPAYWTAEQVKAAIEEATRFCGGIVDVLNEEADNWSAAWGFRLDLRTLRPDAFPVPGRAGARVLNIQLVSSSKADSFADPKTVRLRLEASDGTSATSSNAHAFDAPQKWCNFAFAADGATGAWLPDATLTARFVDASTGEDAAVPLRLGPGGAQPEGTALLVSDEGDERDDLIPYLNTLKFVPVGPTFADAIRELEASKQDALTPGPNITIEDGVISATGADPETETRVAALEQGRGVYKNPSTGAVSIYVPCPECSDGSLKVVIDMGVGAKVLPVEEGDTRNLGAFDDGEAIFFIDGDGDVSSRYGSSPPLYVYKVNYINWSWRFVRLCRKSKHGWWGYGEHLRFSEDYSGQFFFREVGGAGRITCVCNDATLRVLGTEDDIAYLARVSNPGGSPLAVWFNGLTGHTCLLRYQSAKYLVTVYDDLLTPILGDDGAALEVDVTDVCASAKIPTTPQYNAIGRKHVQGHAWLYATTTAGAALLVSTEDDGLAIAHEATLQEDPDNPGKILVERDDDGNMVRDDDLSCIMRPITTEGPEIRFNVKVEAERNYVANAWRAMPHFQRKQISLNYSNSNECHLLTDAIDTWLVLTDGRLIRMDQYGFPPHTTWRTEAPGLNAIVTGRQDCLVSTGVVTLMACGRGTETWANMPAFALIASDARYAGADGLTQNLALKTDAVRGFGQTDGLLPFWPRFGHAPYFCANPLRSPYALIGAPTWLVSHATVADRIL